MAERVTIKQKLSVKCPQCGAPAGKVCGFYRATRNSVSIGFTSPHKERRARYLRLHKKESDQ